MNLNVTNHSLSVGCIQMTAVASSSVLQVGDTEQMTLYSMFDTPPESIIVGPLAPLGEPQAANKTEAEENG